VSRCLATSPSSHRPRMPTRGTKTRSSASWPRSLSTGGRSHSGWRSCTACDGANCSRSDGTTSTPPRDGFGSIRASSPLLAASSGPTPRTRGRRG
jgi:hypothetical protein